MEAQSTISSPQKSQLSPKSSNSKVFKQSFAKLGAELKNKLEKDWEQEILMARKAALNAAKKEGKDLPTEQINLDYLAKPTQSRTIKQRERDVSDEKDENQKFQLPGPGQYKLKSDFDQPKTKRPAHQFFDSSAPRFVSVGMPKKGVTNPDVGPGSYENSDQLAA